MVTWELLSGNADIAFELLKLAAEPLRGFSEASQAERLSLEVTRQ